MAVVVFPALSFAVAVMVYRRPLPDGDRSARSWTVPPLITMSPGTSPPPVPLSGSLLVAVTLSDNSPERESELVTDATCTSWCLAGESVQPVAGIPEMIGPVLSILTASDLESSMLPALSTAEYPTVVVPSGGRQLHGNTKE